jgi:hypothetical protein
MMTHDDASAIARALGRQAREVEMYPLWDALRELGYVQVVDNIGRRYDHPLLRCVYTQHLRDLAERDHWQWFKSQEAMYESLMREEAL